MIASVCFVLDGSGDHLKNKWSVEKSKYTCVLMGLQEVPSDVSQSHGDGSDALEHIKDSQRCC